MDTQPHGWVFDGEIPLEVFHHQYAREYIEGTYMYYRDYMNPYGWYVSVRDKVNFLRWNAIPIEQVPTKYRTDLLLLT